MPHRPGSRRNRGNGRFGVTIKQVRTVCAFCQKLIQDGPLAHGMVSHGMCRPVCEEAKAYGWRDHFPEKPSDPKPAA